MEYTLFKEKIINPHKERENKPIITFLEKNGLNWEKDIEYTVALLEQSQIVGTGSIAGNVLKCIAVDPKHQGTGVSNKIVSHLLHEAYRQGKTHLFIYTKPNNTNMIQDFSFYEVARVGSQVVLLENVSNGLEKYTDKLAKEKMKGDHIAAIVMNCNPFTLGHQFLIEKAASENDYLHVFIVWEDRSTFSPEVRFELVKEGTKNIPNVKIHQGKDYIISNATFPSYFLKEKSGIIEIHAKLDLEIFSNHIAPALEINKRYIGEEPYCPVTSRYNQVMKEVLPLKGIEVIEVPRKMVESRAISASSVRDAIRKDRWDLLEKLLPETTLSFLKSKEADKIIKSIKENVSRH